MQRFFLARKLFVVDDGSEKKEIAIEDGEVVFQMRRVLRMQAGDQFIALDNSGNEFSCKVATIGEKVAKAAIIEKRKNENEPEVFVTLYQALPKKSALFELVLQKGTELGVSAFVPIISARTEKAMPPRRDRLEKIIREAAEQSERGKLPTLTEPIKFAHLFEKDFAASADEQRIVLEGRGDHPSLATLNLAAKKISLFVGPEGGFTKEEIVLASKNGCIIASLGKTVLRTETAGIVAAALLLL